MLPALGITARTGVSSATRPSIVSARRSTSMRYSSSTSTGIRWSCPMPRRSTAFASE
ncbi:hypothetical protein ACFQL4_16495 [Halosimplex aquaticum]